MQNIKSYLGGDKKGDLDGLENEIYKGGDHYALGKLFIY